VSTDLFQALTLGLLVIVILALLVAVSMLGKVRAALEGRAHDEDAGSLPHAQPEAESIATVDEAVAEVAGAVPAARPEGTQAADDGAGVTAAAAEGASTDDDSERPFERGGRWYFRRGGELLVYEEGTGEWVPAPEGESPVSEAVQREAEAVEASTEPAVAEVAEERERVAAEPSTSFAGQPLAAAEEEVATLGGEPAGDQGAAVATGFEEPGGGAVDLEEAATAADEPVARAAESFWKCDSCGAINGSTATTCRMCFAARPTT
jgi:hypothetical protein